MKDWRLWRAQCVRYIRVQRPYTLIVLLLLLTTLAACAAPANPEQAGAQAGDGQAARTRLVIAGPSLTQILDAHQSTDGSRIDIELIGQALIRIDTNTNQPIPDLAESWSFSEDGKTLTFKLPADAKFSNGDPLDAQALKDSWLRYKEISPFASDLASLKDIEVVDATTLKANFDNPPVALLAVLESSNMGAWDVANAKAVGNEAFAVAPITSGPLLVKQFTPGNELLLVRNEHYRTNLPLVQNKGPLHLTEVQVRAIPEEVPLVGELEAGSVDILMGVPGSAIERLRSNQDVQLYEVTTPGYMGLVMNHQRPQFADVGVRQAIAQALDRTAIVKVLGAAAAPQYAFISAAMMAYSPEMEKVAKERYSYNVQNAQAALAAAGWTDSNQDGIVEKDGAPFAVEFLVSNGDSTLQLVSEVIQSQLKAIGIDVKIIQQDPQTMISSMSVGEYDLGFDGNGWRDPDIFSLAFVSDSWNFAHYKNPEMVEQLNAARYIQSPTERAAAYAKLQETWLNDVVEIPLWQYKYFIATRSWVKGLVVNPATGQIFLNDVTIE